MPDETLNTVAAPESVQEETPAVEAVQEAAPQEVKVKPVYTADSDTLRRIFAGAAAVFGLILTAALMINVALSGGSGGQSAQANAPNVAIMDKYDMYITNEVSNALEGVLDIEKVYFLSDDDLVAPKPNAACYGEAASPAELQWLLDDAAELLAGQETLFSTETPAWEGMPVKYYLDDTILVITWKQIIDRSLFTISEVKISHASQFRRFLAGGEYGSDKQYVTTEMAQSVNSVVACSGDFYKFRRYGVIVYDGKVERYENTHVDTCFIDKNGDLLFAYRGDFADEAEAQKFVDDNDVRFSLAFGPVLVDNGEACAPASYGLGEINDEYTRAAICQMDSLHYLMVNISQEGGYGRRQTIANFAKQVESFGCEKAYALDGGQTSVIAMDGQLVSRPDFGTQRQISDIIYFATALPDGE